MSTTLAMPHRLDRSILINAPRETVFGYFTDSERWARWWGQGSTIDARAGGAVSIVHPGGVQVTACNTGGVGRLRNTTSAFDATSAGDDATVAPRSASGFITAALVSKITSV